MLFNGIIFDFDGVLCNSIAAHKDAFKMSLDSLGYVWCKKQEKAYENLKDEKTLHKLKIFADLNFIDAKDIEALNEKKQEFTQPLIEALKMNEKVFNSLFEIKKRKIKIAIASDANKKTIISYLKTNSAQDLFETITTSEDVFGKTKPDPDVYVKTIQLLDLQPKSILVFEDTKKGYASAESAGIKNIQLCTFDNLSNFLEKL